MRVAMDLTFTQSGTLFHGIGNYSMPYIAHLARHPQIEMLYFQSIDSKLDYSGFLAKLSNFIEKNQVEIFHLQSPMQVPFPEVFTSGRLPPVKITATVYDIIPLRFPEIYFHLIDRDLYNRQMEMLRHCHHLFSISEYTRQDFIDIGFDSQTITNMGTGMMDGYYPEAHVNLSDFANSISIDTPYVLAFVPNDFRKNAGRLVEAFSHVVYQTESSIQLVFIGHYTTDVRVHLEKTANQYGAGGRIRFAGHVTNQQLRSLYNGAKALAMPTQYEGLGLPALEALQCNTPVLTSNNTSMPEVVGDAAVYVDPMDVSSIEKGLMSILFDESLRESLQRKGEKQVHSMGWKRTCEHTAKVYKRLLRDSCS